ncbi:MAG: hypothetical protein P1U40_07945 [Coxiellaceae bacterium]|nr:hypothetical protein [Coxiellaceae bacterium]
MQYPLPEWTSSALFSNALIFAGSVTMVFAVGVCIKECYKLSVSQSALIHLQGMAIKRYGQRFFKSRSVYSQAGKDAWNRELDLQQKLKATEQLLDEAVLDRDEALAQRDAANGIAANLMRPIALNACRLMGLPSPVEYDSGGEAQAEFNDQSLIRLRGDTPSPSPFDAYR